MDWCPALNSLSLLSLVHKKKQKDNSQESQQQEVKFQDQVFSKFQDILRCQESQKSEIITFYLAQISHEHQKGSRLNITKETRNNELSRSHSMGQSMTAIKK